MGKKNNSKSKKSNNKPKRSKNGLFEKMFDADQMNALLRGKLRNCAGKIKSKVPNESLSYTNDLTVIIQKMIYPFEEDDVDDFLKLRRDMHPYVRKTDAQLLRESEVHFQYIYGKSPQITKMEASIHKVIPECEEKMYLEDMHKYVNAFVKRIQDTNVQDQFRCLQEYVHILKREPVEQHCTTRHKLIDFYTSHPYYYLIRDLFKSMMMSSDGMRLCQRRYSGPVHIIEEIVVGKLSPSQKPRDFPDLAQLEALRKKRNEHFVQLSNCYKVILARCVQCLPIFLGSGLDEYFEQMDMIKKWQMWKETIETAIHKIPQDILNPAVLNSCSSNEELAMNVYQQLFGQLAPPDYTAPLVLGPEETKKMETIRLADRLIYEAFRDTHMNTNGHPFQHKYEDSRKVEEEIEEEEEEKEFVELVPEEVPEDDDEEDVEEEEDDFDWSVPGTSKDTLKDMMRRFCTMRHPDLSGGH